jgi:hypothetical protein
MTDTTGGDFSKVKYVVVSVSTEASRKRDRIRELNKQIERTFDSK